MTIRRFADYPYPNNIEDINSVADYLKKLHSSLQGESTERIMDFDILRLTNVPWVDVRAYGAKRDGSTDDSKAIQAAIDAVPTDGGIVFFPPGTYKINTGLTISSSNVYLIGAGSESTILDITDLVDFSAISFTGSLSAATALGADANENDISITTSSATGWSVDDLVFIESTAIFGDSTDTRGEIVKIASISDTTITFYTRLFDTYTTADNATVKKITPVKGVKCQGFQILGDEGGDSGLEFKYVENGIIDDLKCIRTDYSGLEIETSYNVNITNYKSLGVCATGTGYGISIHTGCRDIFIDGAHIEESRHAIDIGGTTPCRNIQINNSFLHSKWNFNYAFDVHLGDEISVNNCQIIGGAQTGDCHIVYRDCDFYNNGLRKTIRNRDFTHFHHVTMIGCRIFQHPDATNTIVAGVDLPVTTGTSSLKMYDCEVQCYGVVPSEACIHCHYDDIIIENCVVGSEIANATAISTSSNVANLKVRGNDLSGCTVPYDVDSATAFDFGTNGINSTIADDSVYSFTPGNNIGVIIIYGRNTSYDEFYGIFSYRTTATVFCTKIVGGTTTDATTGALTGTTGADGHITVSTHTDGKIYIENRRGGDASLGIILLGN